ncbi:unnamed protein product [Penicillium olsonii]|uniref:Uncharacterized protein n=1 Tax=Penicillium olsonii TaxID=99116 RepID=A0A9W4MZK2_PENOL|nr:unnamed protein product [Penicillium olsonii]CAG8233252.1 unnamed protein product [Penicillium olsonii]
MGTDPLNSTLQMKKRARVDTPTSNCSCSVTVRMACDKSANNGFISLWFAGPLANSPEKRQDLVLNIIPTIILNCDFAPGNGVRDTPTLSLNLSEPGAVFGPIGTDSLRPFNPDDREFHSFAAICKSTILRLNLSRQQFQGTDLKKLSSISSFLQRRSVQPRPFEFERHHLAPKNHQDFDSPPKPPPYSEQDVSQRVAEVQPPPYHGQTVGEQVISKRPIDIGSTPASNGRSKRIRLPSPQFTHCADKINRASVLCEPNTPSVPTEPNTPSTRLSVASSICPTPFTLSAFPDLIEHKEPARPEQETPNATDDNTSSSDSSPSRSIRPTCFRHAASTSIKHRKLVGLREDRSHDPDEPISSTQRGSHASPARYFRPPCFTHASSPDSPGHWKLAHLEQELRNAPDELIRELLIRVGRSHLLAAPTDTTGTPSFMFEVGSAKAETLEERLERLVDQRIEHYLESGDSQLIAKLTERATSECREHISDEFKTRGDDFEEEVESGIFEVRRAVEEGLEEIRKQHDQCEDDLKDRGVKVVTAAEKAVSNLMHWYNPPRQNLHDRRLCPPHELGINTRRRST